MRASLSAVVAVTLACLAPIAGAQPAPTGYVAPEYIRRPAVLPPGRDVGKALRMTLSDAIETSMRRNLSINLQREQVAQLDTLRSAALSAFEPIVNASVRRDVSRSPPSTRQEGGAGEVPRSERTSLQLSISERLPTGTELRLGLSTSASESMLGTAVLPELVRSSFFADLSQPLLRGFSLDGRVQTAPLLRARFATEDALQRARLEAMLTVKATEEAYWDLVERIKSYEVTAGGLQLAGKQLELTRRQITAGTTPESDLISAEATLAQRELALVQAEVQIDEFSDRLRAILNLPEADWDRPLLPTETPNFLPLQVTVGPALARAQAQRPELKRTEIDLRQVALGLEVARNARLPAVDLQGGYGTVGQDRNFEESFGQVRRGTGRQWNIGLALSWAPLGTGARAEIRRLQSAVRQNALGREQVALDIRRQIRDAVRAIQTAERRLQAAARSRQLTERSLDVEQRRFLNGLSSNFVIAQRQAEVAAAQQAELSALIQHERAASDLQLATGDLLESRRVTFALSGS